MKKIYLIPFWCLFWLFVMASDLLINTTCAAPLTLVDNGKTTFSISVPANAPTSVQDAAQELQRCITIATGVAVPLIQDDAGITGNVISVGSTIYADEARITTDGIPLEGFRIVTRDGSLYIIGPDTETGQRTKDGGYSNGTANGVYHFLEKYMGVRWLLPGDLGRDVPKTGTLRLDDIDFRDAPYFINRRLPYTALTTGKTKPEIGIWHKRQGQGYSFRIEHSHNWEETIPKSVYNTKPELFPLIDGKHPEPQHMYKLETTHPEVIQRFADRAIETLKANPERNTFSLSPSDGFGWSQSPESLALYDKDPYGKQSVTPLILKFYSDVAKKVAEKDPNVKLAGYIYNDYLWPPSSGDLKLPDNFYPVLAGSISYGFRLVRPEVRERFVTLLQEWGKVTPHLFYYDLPDTFVPWTKGHGTIAPNMPDMHNFIFKQLVENNVKGLYIYGNVDWGYGALTNYTWVKLMWNPKLNSYDIQKEWLNRAYGEEAGTVMNQLYLDLEKWFTEFYTTTSPQGHYHNGLVKGFYGTRYQDIEKYILEAKSKTMTDVQRQRFELIENNIIALQWRLRNEKILPVDFKSPLTRTNDEVIRIVSTDNPDFYVFPNYLDIGPKPQPVKATIAPPVKNGDAIKVPLSVRNNNLLLLMSKTDGDIKITPGWANGGANAITYSVKDARNASLAAGVLEASNSIVFTGKANTPYYFYISGGITNVAVEGAAVAYKADMLTGKNLLHLYVRPATMYFHVPAGTKEWNLRFSTTIPNETAKIIVWSPDGKERASVETGQTHVHSLNLEGQEGFWKIKLDKASTGKISNVYLKLDEKLPQWVSIDPQQPLIVE